MCVKELNSLGEALADLTTPQQKTQQFQLRCPGERVFGYRKCCNVCVCVCVCVYVGVCMCVRKVYV